ncbi:MAG TPA: polysaccharide biosynthesis/export family protein [Xanthobacteraceae bacterium]|nr:polysaccharide biosynthesis/export family protein [Xanthobacteraceae bacterium]
MRAGRLLVVTLAVGALAAALGGCMRKPGPRPIAYDAPLAAAQPAPAPTPPPIVAAPPDAAMAQAEPAYTLDSGDKLRVVVFGQEGLSNAYAVDAAGFITMPLIGAVAARGHTTTGLSAAIAEKLRNGYIREPHVAVEVEAYRPFFILGEVTAPGQYPYVANMTAETAVAIAGGFTPRAEKKAVEVSRSADGQLYRGKVPLAFEVRPGDTILVRERWF